MDLMQTDLKFIKGVGPVRSKILHDEIGVSCLRDLLYYFPYKYIDRSVIYRICDLAHGMPYVQLKGRVLSKDIEGTGHRERLVATFSDGTGSVDLVWFNSIKYIDRSLKYNCTYLLLGKPTNWNGRFSISHPELEEEDRQQKPVPPMQPHYHTSEKMKRRGLTSHFISDIMSEAFKLLEKRPVPEVLPGYLLCHYHLVPLDEALRTIHFPRTSTLLPEATRRLKFEELFFLQLDIIRYSLHRKQNSAGFVFNKVGSLFLRFYHECLPFQLTEAQKRVVREVRGDMVSGRQMNRLLQGDVGSGKTMVALLCCLLAVDNGFQACIMAPTEILAEQHYASLSELLTPLPLTVQLLTGNVKGKARKEILQGAADGSVNLLVGTHALIEPTVSFLNLGLVVIDEQHRFGVKQRAQLWVKNTRPPHILVMTATPIPRTLAMTVYGDLDVSVIDELPPGRKSIQTFHYGANDVDRLYSGMRQQLQQGRQIYVVYPLIKENEKQNLRDLETGYAQLTEVFHDFHVGMVHGKMKPADKEKAMHDFITRNTQILVSTTVIEVGVNVPNATVMVVENADRFGLAQLHQLRGRVGRGADQSYCILMTHSRLSESTQRRLQVMVDSNDGFDIAEEDLKLRGPGDMEGTAQSGMPFNLRIANLTKDQELLQVAREAAEEVLEKDPQENLPQNEIMWEHLRLLKKSMVNFSAIS